MIYFLSRRCGAITLADALSLSGRPSSMTSMPTFVRNAGPLAAAPSYGTITGARRLSPPWKPTNDGSTHHHDRSLPSSRRNAPSLLRLHSTTTASSSDNTNDNDNDNTNDNERPAERYAIVSRNRQSMSFRNGSPLVFSGAIEATVHRRFEPSSSSPTTSSDDDGTTIPPGALVAVMVSGKGGDGRADKRRGGGKNRRGRNGRNGKPATDEPERVARHYLIDGDGGSSPATDGETDGGEDGTEEEEDAAAEEAAAGGEMLARSIAIGYGVYNPSSLYRVRILCHQSSYPNMFRQVKDIMTGKDRDGAAGAGAGGGTEEATSDGGSRTDRAIETIVTTKFRDAIRARKGLNLPSASTDSYRLVNGEGDGLSGLAIDVLGGRVAVIMSSAAWCEMYKHVIIKAVESVLRSDHPDYFADEENAMKLVWRTTPSRLVQDGYQLTEDTKNTGSSLVGSGALVGTETKESLVIVTENSIRYKTFPFDLNSQKTGFYVDQRENRLNLSSYCRGKRVLDLCCYTGGFALNAAVHGGASSCVGVDSSQDAIDAATENAALNELPPNTNVQFVKDDIANFMKRAAAELTEDGQYDVIVLDPPKLAPSVSGLERASRKYHSLNRDAMKLINEKEGGMLLTCTCSGAMTQSKGGQYFLETVKGAALSAGRQITLLKSSGAAPCHTQCPASFPAGAYLTAALFYVSPKTGN